jgi:hypothetical protein
VHSPSRTVELLRTLSQKSLLGTYALSDDYLVDYDCIAEALGTATKQTVETARVEVTEGPCQQRQ